MNEVGELEKDEAAMTDALIPPSFGDVRAEYEAVRGGDGNNAGAGLFDLSARGRIEVAGAEAVMFLNGMITNDAAKLDAGAWMLAAFPNVQGRLIAFARVLKLDAQTFIFDTEATTHHAVLKTLERFTLAGDFRVRDLTTDTALLSLQGAAASRIIGKSFGAAAAMLARSSILTLGNGGAPLHVIRATHTAEDGFDMLINRTHATIISDELTSAGARQCGAQVHEILRVEAGIPRHGVDVTDASVVLEAAQVEAVSFTKGCYVGQEIIARIHWRGHVAKQLAGVVFETNAHVATGSPLIAADGKEVGRITSVVRSPALKRTVALATVRYAYLATGTELHIVGDAGEPLSARVVELPFVRGSWYAPHATATRQEDAT